MFLFMYNIHMNRALHPKRRIITVAVGLLCILLIAAILYFKSTFTSAPSSKSTANISKTTPSSKQKNEEGPTQTNILFAAKPSWAQNFATTTETVPDSAYWNVVVGPPDNSNMEQEYYSSDYSNLRIENGALRLIGTKQAEPQGYNYGSARIETQDKKSFLYGRLDVTAKLPSGSGTWPAIWLFPATDTYSNMSSASDSLRYKNGGEIDFMEAVGFQPDTIYGIAHTVSDLSTHSDGTGSFATINVPHSATTFNTYTLLWTPSSLEFQVNGATYFTYARKANATYTTWPYDQPFYLIINNALGGIWGGLDTANFPKNGINDAALPSSLDIKSVYYYPYIGR